VVSGKRCVFAASRTPNDVPHPRQRVADGLREGRASKKGGQRHLLHGQMTRLAEDSDPRFSRFWRSSMRRINHTKLWTAALAVGVLLLGLVPKSNAGYQSGTHDGFFWSLWTDDQSGSVNYSNGSGGNYSVSWNYSGNFTCGKGWSTGSLNRIVGYNIGVYNHGGRGGGVIAYYGWSRNPLREYYVNEMWGTGRPTGTYMGTINSDGGTYDLYRSQRINAPSIDGTQTFWQTYSTRTAEAPTGQNRVITFANHATAWANAGWGLGTDLSPAAILLTEAYGGSNGNSNATVWLAGSGGGGGGGGTTRRYESANFGTYFIRHQGYRGRVDPNVNPLADSQFIERAGLNGVSGTVSLESVNFPGRFLRHRTNGEVWLDQNDNTAAFRNSATWFKRAGLSNSGASSFEAQSNPGTYMRHRNYLLYRESVSGAANADATFWTR
jgi:hypothetical protein